MRITRLSQGVDANRTLQKDALQRSFDALSEYRKLMDSFNVSSGLLVATSAVRDASNGNEFISRAKEITAVHARVLTGNEEAQFSFSGATAGIALGSNPIAILDIGGGSTELAAMIDGQLESYSMQLGCVRVTERTLGRAIVSSKNEAAAKEMIQSEVEKAFSEVPGFEKLVGNVQLMGLAGTVATLAQLDAGLTTYERDAVHLRSLSRETVEKWYETLKALAPEERLSLAGMVPGREDVMPSGLLILGAVMDRLKVNQLLSSENDILDGVVATLLGA